MPISLELLSADPKGLDTWRCPHGNVADFYHTGRTPTRFPCTLCVKEDHRLALRGEIEKALEEIIDEADDVLSRNIPEHESYLTGYIAGLKRAIRKAREIEVGARA